ncbi:MAG: TonB-dependent receptor [Caulobacterales bacterium]
MLHTERARAGFGTRRALIAAASSLALAFAMGLAAGAAQAADATATATADTAPSTTGAGAEGTEVERVIVEAESDRAAATAPVKASLEQTQPESIISHQYIEQATPETGGWVNVVSVAPSISGIGANGGGVGEYTKVTMRGFQDGQFNITYDGISFADTNDPTHHQASYWPASTIGAAVVDRGPGAAGDLGQANFGGAIHYFSPIVDDHFGVVQKLTFGSFNTYAAVTTINTGSLPGGGRLLLNFDERWSSGELSKSGGSAFNQLVKFELPLGERATLTMFSAFNYIHFNFIDGTGPGETWAQVLAYGKNFAMNTIPTDEHYYLFNYENKSTDFEYIDLKGEVTPSLSVEDQAYTYWYQNRTVSANDGTGLVGVGNTSPPNITTPPQSASDIGGYDKLNEYRVWGNIVRISKQWSFGTVKFGGLVETSNTTRHNLFIDLTLGGIPDNKFHPPKYPFTTNAKLQESSNWLQGQFFVDFDWQVTSNFRISPGFKYVDFTRNVNAANENVGGGSKNQPLIATNRFTSPLYFVTANYKIQPFWSIYGQAATSFLIPSLSALYVTGASVQGLKSETTTSYQLGTVYSRGDFTMDADVYLIDADNLYNNCQVPNPTPGNPASTTAGFCNFGKARYSGFEGEAAYAFDFGLTLFANGSINNATQLANAANLAAGISANPQQELQNAPEWTDAFGALLHHGPWQGSISYKQSGRRVVSYISGVPQRIPGYDSVDGSVAYDFGRVKVKLQVFNLLDKRAITSFGGTTLFSTTDSGVYTFQSGREVSLTLIGKF